MALQSIAWGSMLVTNARQVSLVEAVAKTFDGSHPCDLCHVVAEGKKAEKKSEAVPAPAKMDLICATGRPALRPPWAPYDFAVPALAWRTRGEAPLTPPPRLGLA